MKSSSILVLACLVSMPAFAQSLPDEINYGPYETRYRGLETEADAARLLLSRSEQSLQNAKKFIREEMAHIESLENDISSKESEISRLLQEIPVLQNHIANLSNEDMRTMNDLRNREGQANSLGARLRDAERDLRPMEDLLARKQLRIRELEREVSGLSVQEREASQRFTRTQREAERLDASFTELRNQIRGLQNELGAIDGRINSIQSQIAQNESLINTLTNSLNMETGKLAALNNRVAENESEVAALRASGAAADVIAQAERKLNAIRNTRDNTADQIREIERQISRQQSLLSSQKAQIEELGRNQGTIPTRIAALEGRARQIESQRGQIQNELNRYSTELNIARRNLELRQQHLMTANMDIRNDEQNVLRQRQFVENLDRQLDSLRAEIAALNQRSRSLNAQIAKAQTNIRENEVRVPQLQQTIRSHQADITQGEADLVRARQDESTFTVAVARDQAKLTDLITRRDNAQNEWDQRLSRYNGFFNEAQNLGSSQGSLGISPGEKEGEKLSSLLSRKNGQAVGRELGISEAKYWGNVRGEIQGFDLGYSEGLASSEDIQAATQVASSKASTDAELFAQTNFKPVFFEEFILEEFKRPLISIPSAFKSFKAVKFIPSFESRREFVSPLTPNELARSEELITPLDSVISQNKKDVKLIEAKAQRLINPEIVFQAPVAVPFGTPACTQVYKGLSVFKTACEGAYKSAFASQFLASAKAAFVKNYPQEFQAQFDTTNLSAREESFPADLANATKIGRAEGVRIGKIEIYQTTFEKVYKSAYASEIGKARLKARGDASAELQNFLKVRPLLTLASTALSAEYFRGGEEVSISGKVKNVGQVAFNGAGLIRVIEIINAERISGEAVFNSAAPLALTDLPILKVKLSQNAKSGDKVIVRGVVELPGDLYRPTRPEKFELTQTLSANPLLDLGLNYNKTPSIKGVFRRNIHFLTATLTPKIEDLKEGYLVTITPSKESLEHMELQVSSLETGSVALNVSKDARLSYVFKDSAKGKTISIELTVSYVGKIIKKETITLIPR